MVGKCEILLNKHWRIFVLLLAKRGFSTSALQHPVNGLKAQSFSGLHFWPGERRIQPGDRLPIPLNSVDPFSKKALKSLLMASLHVQTLKISRGSACGTRQGDYSTPKPPYAFALASPHQNENPGFWSFYCTPPTVKNHILFRSLHPHTCFIDALVLSRSNYSECLKNTNFHLSKSSF